MGITADREEFNNSGLRGIVNKLRQEGGTGYVIETDNGWRGQLVSARPSLGTSPFLYVTPGFPVMRYENRELDGQPTEFSEHV